MKLNCCIIDDEPLAIKLLESYVIKTPGLELAGTYNSAVEALEGLANQPVDLIFCDIQMPELNGLQFAEMIKPLHSRIIFTTAFSEYAIEGWKADALHYLLKPISYTDFLAAVNKAYQWFEMSESRTNENNQTEAITQEETNDEEDALGQTTIVGDGMFVKSDYKLVKVLFDQILYIEGLKDYVKIYVENEKRAILSLTSMKAVEAALPTANFMRTHRSYIVNMNQVKVVERGHIVFGEKHIPVSDSYKDAVLNYVAARTLQGRN